ncbi:hypothetical protein [Dyadobacter frigoris]|uniref:Uncharacterized protein n=1 Tax=Dyadobacter frigoris TaxID=2576211 RepID=A0A4U6D956_9BACT|nr:hypothetical protein [Dyadobacter frigoris]TKT90754.1 hypothetical protein FDK13_17450 [Dyadobacter frigoris]GLU52088.1 hypothetical protein Dfri01_15490 [Dyadobacter frigoris]
MKSWLLTIVFLISAAFTFAQNTPKVYRTKNGSNISKNIPYQEQYQFEEFNPGKVYFRNGRIANARLNYNLFYGEIEFIDTKNDTLLLNDQDFMDSIAIGSEIFYYLPRQGHIREIKNYGKVRLGEKQVLAVLDNERESAYNHYSATSAISNYKTFSNQNGSQWMKPSDNVVFKRKSIHFFIDKNKQFYIPSKASTLKLFRDNSKEINDYIKEQNIDFSKQSDLTKLLEFCNSL